FALCLGTVLFGSGAAHASAIAWSLGPIFSGLTGYNAILTNGTVVAAVDAGPSSGSLTVAPKGITFTGADVLDQGSFASGSPGSNDANWNSIIDSADWNGTNTVLPSFLSGLIVGRSYQIQLFASDTRTCCAARTQFF